MPRTLTAAALLFFLAPAALAARPAPVTRPNWELAAQWGPDQINRLTRSQAVYPNWIDGGDVFWYRYLTAEGRFYWLVDPDRGVKEPLFDRRKLAAALARSTGEEIDPENLDLDEFTFAEDLRRLGFVYGRARFEFDRKKETLAFVDSVTAEPATEAEPWRNLSPDGRWCLFARANNLYLCGADELASAAVQLSCDGVYGLSWGADWELIADEDTTCRRIDVTWSPDSRRFCVKRADLRQVRDLWVVDHLAEPWPVLKTFKMPPPGGVVPQWELWIGDCTAATLTRVQVERWPDQTLDSLFTETTWWAPDSQILFFTRRHRDYTKVDVCAADPATGLSRTLIEERLPGMVYVRTPTALPATGEALWWSMRSGWGHLYRYGLGGQLRNPLTAGAWMVDEVIAVDEPSGTVFFTGLGREEGGNPYNRHLYRVNLDGGGLRLLTPEDATHSCTFSPTRRYFVDVFSRPDAPTRSVIRDAEGWLAAELETADISLLTDAGWRAPEVFHVPGADGVTEQWGVMYKPFDFDARLKYPIVTRVYPGKQGEFVPWSFQPLNIETYLAQLGCIVVRFGNRGGTPERGLAYREFGRDDFRDYGLPDKKVVIENLAAAHPWIDLERVGIYGGSSGGFMTVSAMLVHPEFFKVGVAMSSPNDPLRYYNHWVERYAGVEMIEHEDGTIAWRAEADGNLELAGNLQGRLLLINGAQDENVHPLHLMRMADAFIKAGKCFDMFVVPGAGHDLGDWRHLYTLVFDYFAEHLIGQRRKSVDSLFIPPEPES